MTPEEIRARRFKVRRRRGYDMGEVDELLERAAATLTATGRSTVARVTGGQLRAARFRTAGPGYDQGEVQGFLTAVASALDAAPAPPAAVFPGIGRPAALSLTAEQVRNQRFQATKYREGYLPDQVDALLARAVAALTEAAAGRPFTHLLSREQVVRSRFTATKFRNGYDQDEVDAFLDRLAAALDR